MELTCEAGLVPEKAEFLQYHVHAHLDVFVNGRPRARPGRDRDRHRQPGGAGATPSANGSVIGAGLTQECDQPCISPLHTHDLVRPPAHGDEDAGAEQARPVLHASGPSG